MLKMQICCYASDQKTINYATWCQLLYRNKGLTNFMNLYGLWTKAFSLD